MIVSYGNKSEPTLETVMIDSMITIATLWHLAHLAFTIFNLSNITVIKDSLCLVIFTKPLLTEPSCSVYVWKAALQGTHSKGCHVHLLKATLIKLAKTCCSGSSHKAIEFMKVIKLAGCYILACSLFQR